MMTTQSAAPDSCSKEPRTGDCTVECDWVRRQPDGGWSTSWLCSLDRPGSLQDAVAGERVALIEVAGDELPSRPI